MPRLLFVSKYVDHILFFFLQQLAKEVELSVVVDQHNHWTESLARDHGKLTYLAPRSKFDRSFRGAIADLRARAGWDLIQCFHGNDQLANLIIWNRRRIPLVAYRGRIGHLKFRENPAAYWNARNPGLAAVAAVSTEVKRYLESFRLLRAQNVRVMPHGINQDWVDGQLAARRPLRVELGIPGEALIVVSMAVLRPVKRFDYIVHAAEKLAAAPVHFVHLGDPRGWDLKCAHLPKVHFLGQQPEPLPLLAGGDVFAMTSHNEAFGRANLEAMACGMPVIGSNTGGLLDLVDPGVTGQLFETTSPDDFVACVERYVGNRRLVAEHGRNARSRVREKFSTDIMVANYLGLYRDMLAGRGPNQPG